MNIFYLDKNEKLCASYHCNSHVVKMITEHNQMLCTNLYILNGIDKKQSAEHIFTGFPRKHANGEVNQYKQSHVNHPCTKWLRKSRNHTEWLLSMNKELCVEYTIRYRRHHAGEAINNWLINAYKNVVMPSIVFENPPLAMPSQYKTDNPVESYRRYYINDKSRFAKWTNRNMPEWWLQAKENLSPALM